MSKLVSSLLLVFGNCREDLSMLWYNLWLAIIIGKWEGLHYGSLCREEAHIGCYNYCIVLARWNIALRLVHKTIQAELVS